MKIETYLHREDIKEESKEKPFGKLELKDFNISKEMIHISSEIVFHPSSAYSKILLRRK